MEQNYDRARELKAFDDTKAGVKGLVDSGVTKIPRIFHQPLESLTPSSVSVHTNLSIPTIIDLENFGNDSIRREEIVNEVRDAPERWSFKWSIMGFLRAF
ncbi:hypothetical protein TIFTF001_022597 [Ficus carica]|uniref:Uncharacterized protein n=1 Tax=Ficus carica TaxID=3494 RepID=A0AA88DFM8_FICCA|nr:hypothetical protein TIFTF001_022597 [Ficus carica]